MCATAWQRMGDACPPARHLRGVRRSDAGHTMLLACPCMHPRTCGVLIRCCGPRAAPLQVGREERAQLRLQPLQLALVRRPHACQRRQPLRRAARLRSPHRQPRLCGPARAARRVSAPRSARGQGARSRALRCPRGRGTLNSASPERPPCHRGLVVMAATPPFLPFLIAGRSARTAPAAPARRPRRRRPRPPSPLRRRPAPGAAGPPPATGSAPCRSAGGSARLLTA